MSAAQSVAIKAWWDARKAAGWSAPKMSAEEARRRDRERQAIKRKAHPEAHREASKRRYYADHEAVKAKRRQKYAEQANRHRAIDKARRAAHPERYSELSRARYERNRERKLAVNTAWREKNRERVRANARRRDALKARTAIGPVDYRAILAASGGLCGICGGVVDASNPKAYHYDHIVPLARGGAHVQSNIQLAHAKCNMRKWAKSA